MSSTPSVSESGEDRWPPGDVEFTTTTTDPPWPDDYAGAAIWDQACWDDSEWGDTVEPLPTPAPVIRAHEVGLAMDG